MKRVFVVLMLVSMLGLAQAAVVTTAGSDGFGGSSFNSAGVWSDASAPSAGNDYVIDDEDRVRTPADGGSHVFAGDSLTVKAVGSGGDFNIKGLSYKGTGNAGSITIDNLILDGGSVNHINGEGDVFNLYGNINVISDSIIHPKQGPINIYSAISGAGGIYIPGDSGSAACKLWVYSPSNTYTGNIVNDGRFGLVDDANLNFVIGASGVNNYFDGVGHKHATFDGDFILDLTGAGTTLGDSWTIVNAPLAVYYGSTFTVAGFSAAGDGIWNGSANDAMYQFDQGTGMLTVVPEPATMALLGLGGLVLARRKR